MRFVNHQLQILPNQERSSYARYKVQVYASLDGNMAVYYGNQRLDNCPAPLESTKLRVPVTAGQSTPHYYAKPSLDHPWRVKFRSHFD